MTAITFPSQVEEDGAEPGPGSEPESEADAETEADTETEAGSGGSVPVGQDDTPTSDRRGAVVVGSVAAALSIAAYVYFASRHLTVAYKDAYSHLEIGRRVIAGQTPGIAQLGGVWLPLPHILQELFAWNSTLYRTGLSGGLVSMACYVVCSVFVYRIVRVFDSTRQWPAMAAAAVFMTNPNVLYLQSTAMDELPFYACTLVMVYFLVSWASTGRPAYLLAASLASMAAMLCRYEAWAMAVAYVACVAVMARRLGHTWQDVRGLTLVATVFGFASSALSWLFYNWAIFGSPLNFLTGQDSAKAQTVGRQDPEIGSWLTTLHAYATAATANLGLAVIGIAVAALGFILYQERGSARTLPILCLLLLVPFLILSVESGQVALGVPEINGDLYNLRFGLAPLLPASLLIGYLLTHWPRRWPAPWAILATTALVAVVTGTSFAQQQIVLAAEAAGASEFLAPQTQTADILVNQTTGTILMNAFGNERVLFPVLERTIYEGSKNSHADLWRRALNNPKASGIQVIVMRANTPTPDDVYVALHSSPMLDDYRMVFHNDRYSVYELK